MAPLQGPLQEEAADESDTFQVRGSESLAAKRLIDEKFARGSEMAAVIAYVTRRRARRPRTASGSRRDARAICRSGAIPTLTLVGTPYGLACGDDDPLDLSPGPGAADLARQQPRARHALMTDDSTQTAEAAVETIRSIVPPPTGDGPARVRHRRGGLRGRPQRGGQGHRRDAAAGHLRRARPAAAGDLPLAAGRARPDLRRRRGLRRRGRAHLRARRAPASPT